MSTMSYELYCALEAQGIDSSTADIPDDIDWPCCIDPAFDEATN